MATKLIFCLGLGSYLSRYLDQETVRGFFRFSKWPLNWFFV